MLWVHNFTNADYFQRKIFGPHVPSAVLGTGLVGSERDTKGPPEHQVAVRGSDDLFSQAVVEMKDMPKYRSKPLVSEFLYQ